MFRNRYSKRMRLYHGSDQSVRSPRILKTGRTMDFGEGFCTARSRQQASDWAKTVGWRRRGGRSTVTEYEYEESDDLRILIFEGPTEDWLEFVLANRNGDFVHDYDIILGPVADDGVYDTLMDYSRGYLTKEMAIEKLKVREFDGQMLFHTDKSLDCLTYVGEWEVKRRSTGGSSRIP